MKAWVSLIVSGIIDILIMPVNAQVAFTETAFIINHQRMPNVPEGLNSTEE
jgi:hypothetical protein